MLRVAGLLVLVGVVALSGCGGVRGPKTVSVSGIVKLDGNPLEDAEVHFVSEKHAGFGKTDSQGKFKLITGAVVGQNKVYFSKIREGSFGAGTAESGLDRGQAEAAAAAQGMAGGVVVVEGQAIPDEYASEKASKLTFTVPEGGTDSANFDIDTPKK